MRPSPVRPAALPRPPPVLGAAFRPAGPPGPRAPRRPAPLPFPAAPAPCPFTSLPYPRTNRKNTMGPPVAGWPHRKDVRRRPTLPRGPPRSTIGADRLSFRVRNGAGRFPVAMAAETLWRCQPVPDRISGTAQWTQARVVASYRLISTGQLHESLVLTSTSGLSTQCATWDRLGVYPMETSSRSELPA